MPSSTAVNSRDGEKQLDCRISPEVEQIRFADGLDFGYKKGVVKGDAGVSDLNYQEDGFSRTEIENAVAGAD